MKSILQLKEKLKMNNKGVFGLTSVQAFFAVVLGIALLAYVIVIIMNVMTTSSILGSSLSGTVTNETVIPTTSGTNLAAYTNPNCVATIVTVLNGTTGTVITAGNYTTDGGCKLLNLTATYNTGTGGTNWNVSYTYTYDNPSTANSKSIMGNTSSGVSGFFGNVSPVYAILAILVIILVLVVLVRVVTGGEGVGGRVPYNPQL